MSHLLIELTEGFELPIVEKADVSSNRKQKDASQTEEVSNSSIYPNPTNIGTSVNIALQNTDNQESASFYVEVYDLTLYGKLWFQQDFNVNQTQITLPSNLLKAGFYVVKLYKDDVLIETKMLRID